MRYCYAGKIPELIAFSNDISKSGREKQKSFLIYALKILSLCLAVNARAQSLTDLEEEEVKFITGFAPYIPNERVVTFNTLFNDAIYHVERNIHIPTLFLDLSLKIVQQFKPNVLPLR
jgi:DNA polymerase-3 subunit delta'